MSPKPKRAFWLVKTEPKTFSIADLEASPKHTTRWDGVRNYQARNHLRNDLNMGDGVLIYHSCATPLSIVGTAEVVKVGYPDPSQFDPESPYFDANATKSAPRWWCVDLLWRSTFKHPVLRSELTLRPECADLMLLRRGSRLSVQPVPERAWGLILALAQG